MSLPVKQVIEGLNAAHAANTQHTNICDFNLQIDVLEDDPDKIEELAETESKKSRAERRFKQYIAMGGIFFGREVPGAADDPILSGQNLPYTED